MKVVKFINLLNWFSFSDRVSSLSSGTFSGVEPMILAGTTNEHEAPPTLLSEAHHPLPQVLSIAVSDDLVQPVTINNRSLIIDSAD